MDTAHLQTFLLGCLALNYAILMLWFVLFVYAHDGIHRLHSRWFQLSPETFDALNYGAMAVYKIGVLIFVAVPLLVLWLGN